MPNIQLCRHYIERNYPHLLNGFDSLALKIKESGTDPRTFSEQNLQKLDLNPEEWKVLKILICAMGDQSLER